MRKFFNFILILIIGGLGGILADQFLMPYLSNTSPFDKISWLSRFKDGTTIINKTEKVVIQENIAFEETISKVSSSVVGVISKNKQTAALKTKKISQEIIAQGTGFIVTSDGLIMTASSLVTGQSYDYFVLKDGQSFPAEVFKGDLNSGLVLLKIKETNLPVVSFANFENLRLGERVVLIGVDVSSDMEQDPSGFALRMTRFVNLGIIKNLTEENFSINLEQEYSKATGGPLINIKGEVIGLNLIDNQGKIKIVPVTEIKKFLSP